MSETHDNTEIGNKYDDNSTTPSLFSEGKMDAISSGDEYDTKPMCMKMLEYIW